MKLKCDEPLSNVAFNFNLRRYNTELWGDVVEAGDKNSVATAAECCRQCATTTGWGGAG